MMNKILVGAIAVIFLAIAFPVFAASPHEQTQQSLLFRPNANGTWQTWGYSGTGISSCMGGVPTTISWGCVEDEVNNGSNGDVDYISTTTNAINETYQINKSDLSPWGDIVSVVIWMNARTSGVDEGLKSIMRLNNTSHYIDVISSPIFGGNTYTDYQFPWNTNPGNGSQWNIGDIHGIQIGVSSFITGGNNISISNIWLNVTFNANQSFNTTNRSNIYWEAIRPGGTAKLLQSQIWFNGNHQHANVTSWGGNGTFMDDNYINDSTTGFNTNLSGWDFTCSPTSSNQGGGIYERQYNSTTVQAPNNATITILCNVDQRPLITWNTANNTTLHSSGTGQVNFKYTDNENLTADWIFLRNGTVVQAGNQTGLANNTAAEATFGTFTQGIYAVRVNVTEYPQGIANSLYRGNESEMLFVRIDSADPTITNTSPLNRTTGVNSGVNISWWSNDTLHVDSILLQIDSTNYTNFTNATRNAGGRDFEKWYVYQNNAAGNHSICFYTNDSTADNGGRAVRLGNSCATSASGSTWINFASNNTDSTITIRNINNSATNNLSAAMQDAVALDFNVTDAEQSSMYVYIFANGTNMTGGTTGRLVQNNTNTVIRLGLPEYGNWSITLNASDNTSYATNNFNIVVRANCKAYTGGNFTLSNDLLCENESILLYPVAGTQDLTIANLGNFTTRNMTFRFNNSANGTFNAYVLRNGILNVTKQSNFTNNISNAAYNLNGSENSSVWFEDSNFERAGWTFESFGLQLMGNGSVVRNSTFQFGYYGGVRVGLQGSSLVGTNTTKNYSIVNNTFFDMAVYGIWADVTNNTSIENNVIRNVGSSCIGSGDSNYTIIRGNSCYNSSAQGIETSAAVSTNNVTISNNFINLSITGIKIASSKEIFIFNNTITQITGGVSFGGILLQSGSANNNSIYNNILSDGTNGINAQGGNNNLIYSNNLTNFTSNAIVAGNANITLTSNQINRSATGIYFASCNWCIANGNLIYNNSAFGIDIENTKNASLTNNTVFNSSTGIKLFNVNESSRFSELILYNNTKIGISTTSSNNTTFSNSNFYNDGISFIGRGNITYLNTTHNSSNYTFASTSSALWTIQWYINGNITDSSGNPIQNAETKLNDTNGTNIWNNLATGTDGLTPYRVVNESDRNRTVFRDYNNHTLLAWRNGYSDNNITLNLSSSQTIRLSLTGGGGGGGGGGTPAGVPSLGGVAGVNLTITPEKLDLKVIPGFCDVGELNAVLSGARNTSLTLAKSSAIENLINVSDKMLITIGGNKIIVKACAPKNARLVKLSGILFINSTLPTEHKIDINVSIIGELPDCPAKAQYVCGADGKTYLNPCYASYYEVKIKHADECTLEEQTPLKVEKIVEEVKRTGLLGIIWRFKWLWILILIFYGLYKLTRPRKTYSSGSLP